jgi:hypothetical protein
MTHEFNNSENQCNEQTPFMNIPDHSFEEAPSILEVKCATKFIKPEKE